MNDEIFVSFVVIFVFLSRYYTTLDNEKYG